MNTRKLYCTCGTVVGQMEFSHIDPNLKTFDGGRVYKNTYNGNEARDKDNAIIPFRHNHYMCKECYSAQFVGLKNWIAVYTNDHGVTTNTSKVSAKNYSQAYISAMMKIDGIIIELMEEES